MDEVIFVACFLWFEMAVFISQNELNSDNFAPVNGFLDKCVLVVVLVGWMVSSSVYSQDVQPVSPGGVPSGVSTGFEGSRTSQENIASSEEAIRIQIQVDAPTPAIKAAFKTAAESVRLDFQKILQLPLKKWVIPIHIKIVGDPADIWDQRDLAEKVSIRPDQTILITLNVRLHEAFSAEDFEREMLHVLILHEMLRGHAKHPNTLQGDRLVVPAWLIYGLKEHLLYRKRGTRSDLFAGILEGGNIMKVRDILTQQQPEKLDPMSRAIFESSAAALISTLLDQPDGSAGFQGLLMSYTSANSLPTGDPTTRLKEHFPEMRENSESLGKWWTLQLAAMSEMTMFDSFTVLETQQMLNDATRVIIGERESGSDQEKKGFLGRWLKFGKGDSGKGKGLQEFRLSDFDKFIDHPNLERDLNRNRQIIRELQAQGFPLYRSLARRYELLFGKILSGKKLGVAAEIRELRELQSKIDATLERVNDYMNYYEATQAPTSSDAFEGYREMREKLENASPPPRNDRISKYLDDLEREFE